MSGNEESSVPPASERYYHMQMVSQPGTHAPTTFILVTEASKGSSSSASE